MSDIQKSQNKFLPPDFKVTTWEALEPFYKDLAERPIETLDDYAKFLEDENELAVAVYDEEAWRYVQKSRFNNDADIKAAFDYFNNEIEPNKESYMDAINRKIEQSPFAAEFDEPGFQILMRGVKDGNTIYREENIELSRQITELAMEANNTRGAWKIDLNGQMTPVTKAASELQSPDRDHRQKVWEKIQQARLADRDKMDGVMDKLVDLRVQQARNAGFHHFRDYRYIGIGQYAYTAEDCFDFHESVHKEVMPIVDEIIERKKQDMGVEILRPWDLGVDSKGRPPLKAAENMDELVDKTIRVFQKIDPEFGFVFQQLKDMGQLDLESRDGKHTNGYNMPLRGNGTSFVFANMVPDEKGVITNVHEGGHAVHGYLTHKNKDIKKMAYMETPSEVAELASMTTELLTLDHWDVFFENDEDLVRAKTGFWNQVLMRLPQVAMIDRFQHRLYGADNNAATRTNLWKEDASRYKASTVDWSGYEDAFDTSWHAQMHITEVPFYYVQYGMAQLGAIQVYMNYKKDPKQALKMFKNGLSLGNTKEVPEIYETAGVKFDFSPGTIKDVANFVRKERAALTI